MSQDFKKVCVMDDRLDVSSDIDFAVFKGAQSKVESSFNAISESTSQLTFNVQVPSELTIIDREVILESTYTIVMSGTPNNGEFLFDYGNGHALAPYPVHQSMTTATSTINNNSVSLNVRDVLPAILRMNDRRYLARYNGSCPVAYDNYFSYDDAVDTNNNPNGSYNNTSDMDLMPRGAFDLVSVGGNTIGNGVDPRIVTIKFKTFEPLLLSPYIFADPKKSNQGFYGIQNLNFIFNLGSPDRIIRGVDNCIAGAKATFALSAVENSKLHFNFLTAPPSVLLPPKNVVPYYELPRYVKQADEVSGLADGATTKVSSQSIQLNQVPDKLIVFMRKKESSSNYNDSDSSLVIDGISINFNNVSGLLSSAKDIDLWKMSVKAGSNQTWQEYSGKANSYVGGASQQIPTVGSYLVLDFAKDIPLSEPYYAPSSLGQFQLQFDLDVKNQTGAALADPYELVIITMNSGLFVCERGTSATYTAILTKQDVLDASESAPRVAHSDMRRMVGGGMFGDLLSMGKAMAMKHAPKLASAGKHLLAGIDHPAAQIASKALGMAGFGASGGGVVGGRMASHLM